VIGYYVWEGQNKNSCHCKCFLYLHEAFECAEAWARGEKTAYTKDFKPKVGIEEIEVDYCPTCGKLEDKEILNSFGECLRCEEIRGDAEADAAYERRKLGIMRGEIEPDEDDEDE